MWVPVAVKLAFSCARGMNLHKERWARQGVAIHRILVAAVSCPCAPLKHRPVCCWSCCVCVGLRSGISELVPGVALLSTTLPCPSLHCLHCSPTLGARCRAGRGRQLQTWPALTTLISNTEFCSSPFRATPTREVNLHPKWTYFPYEYLYIPASLSFDAQVDHRL